jgi:Rho GTPase-activating protein 1
MCTDLMHEVSLRSASNRMDAHNLAVVLCPNLVSGPSPARDVIMCSVPGGPSLYESNAPRSNFAAPSEGKTTLGMIIKLCIERYFEIFDEVKDRSEAVPPQPSFREQGPVSSEASSASGSPRPQQRNGLHNDDDEDIDDAMLVMPIGPSPSHEAAGSVPNGNGTSPPSAWGAAPVGATFKPRHRSALSGGSSSAVRSMYTVGEGTGFGGSGMASISRSKSMISIEKGMGTVGRKGTITVGRGTTRKSAGAGVEAISITAEGFFSAPSSVPPVPRLTKPNGAESVS